MLLVEFGFDIRIGHLLLGGSRMSKFTPFGGPILTR
jgi:hypothetical protein